MKSIAQQHLNLPPHAPVMFLPGAVLFPNALLPLFIFEPRYRAMLAHCLEQGRMFCIALLKPGIEEVRGPEDFYDVAGLGLVRACVGRDDGTSHLVLQGLARVRLGAFVQEAPFRIAEVRELAAPPAADAVETETLRERVREICAKLPLENSEVREKLNEQLIEIVDPCALCDLVAHTFIRDSERRQEILETLEPAARLRATLRHLRKEMSAE